MGQQKRILKVEEFLVFSDRGGGDTFACKLRKTLFDFEKWVTKKKEV